ncbi:MAG: tetratricopeptide repeat protein [Microbacter sp.]
MAKNSKETPDNLEHVETVLTKSEIFIEKYQKQIIYVVGVVVLIVLAILALRNWYIVPREKDAQNKLAVCQNYFAVDSFQVALNGNGTDQCIGFKGILDEYGWTKAGDLANVYAGICYYRLGDFKNAIQYLKKFHADDVNESHAVTGLIGDCYVNLGQTEEGIHYFLKAADTQNDLVSPIYLKKAGIAYESLGKYKDALAIYTKIKEQYAQSQEASDIDRYIGRATVLAH